MRKSISCCSLGLVGGLGLSLLLPLTAAAAPVSDAQGDWYAGSVAASHRADLDVKSADGIYEDGVGWHLTASMWGNIDTTQAAVYVWGFGRGSSAAVTPFAGETNVTFDSVLSLDAQNGTASVRQLDTGVTNTLAAANFGFSGDTLTAFIPESYLPTVAGGFDDDDFTWNLWPRLPGGPATNIADFAPDNAMRAFTTVPAGAVPEPGSASLLLSALPIALLYRRRKCAPSR
jgi:hypothetical protein